MMNYVVSGVRTLTVVTCGGQLVTVYTFDHLVLISLRVVRRVEDDVTWRQGRDWIYNQIALWLPIKKH
jgi:hypothetical protein